MSKQYILKMEHISKQYDGNPVLKDVSLNVGAGEVLALIGENGAGKSTLMNILFGMSQIQLTGGFKGTVWFDGQKVNIHSPQQAMKLGIGMVHQEFMLLPGFTITENIKLNREILKPTPLSRIFGRRMSMLNRRQMAQDARLALAQIDLNLDEQRLIEGMPVGYMQFIEIAREIDKTNMKLIVFDEPTAVLTETEARRLLDIIRQISTRGVAVIFISHKLDEIMQIADSVVVMRDGESVCSVAATDTNVIHLAELMVGRGIDSNERMVARDLSGEPTVMEINSLQVDMPGEIVRDFSINIRQGEILGIGGLAGQGKIGVANGVLGVYPTKGEVRLNSEILPRAAPLEVLKKRIAFVSEDRRGMGLILSQSIEDNIAVGALRVKNRFLKKYGPLTQRDGKKIRQHADRMISDFKIKCTGPRQQVSALSGGNQQKVCIARALTMEPDILFVSEPTRGIDIGAKKLLLDHLVELNRSKGVTIVITSSELKELRSICDRIAIVTGGRLSGILGPDASDADFGLMMSGVYDMVKKEAQI